jgi:dUTPase
MLNVVSFSHTAGANSNVDPVRKTAGSAGLDLTLPRTSVVAPLETVFLDHRLTVRFPPGVYGVLALRSSSAKLDISLRSSVIGERERELF